MLDSLILHIPRLIPVLTGNSEDVKTRYVRRTVNPRAYGEQSVGLLTKMSNIG